MIFSRLRHASFRGVKFQVEEAAAEFGRRKKVHEFFGRDDFEVEDLGKGPRRYPVDGYLVGHDYDLARDMLVKACERETPGTLIHPYHGMVEVLCLKLSVSETFREGNYCKVKFDFIEAPRPPLGGLSFGSALDLVKAADDLLAESALQFAEAFSVLMMPAYVATAAAAVVNKAADFMISTNGFGAIPDATAQAVTAIKSLRQDIERLVRSPIDLASHVGLAILSLASALALPDLVDGLFAVHDEVRKLPLPDPLTPSRKQERANQRAFTELVHRGAIYGAIKGAALSGEPYVAGGTRKEFSLRISREMRAAMTSASDSVFQVMGDLHKNLVTSNSQLFKGARELTTRHVATPTSALMSAYENGGNLGDDLLIASLNRLPHPGFISAGTILEVPDA